MLPNIKPSKKAIYLDHAATTYLDPRVKSAMEPFWSKVYGNPSALYKQGREALNALDVARKNIASVLNCRTDEIIFTAGGSESINLAILGLARTYRSTHPQGGHIISSVIEHHAVLHCLDALKQEGFSITLIGVDEHGFVDPQDVKKAIQPDTILVSIMHANNEIGTIEPIGKIGNLLAKENVLRTEKKLSKIYFHTDACQTAGALDINVNKLGVDLLSANGSKIYGPKQTGFLYVKSGLKLKPLIYGGGQERNLRSGTENVAGVVGLAEALKLSHKEQAKENKRLISLRDYFIKKLLQTIPKVVVNGPYPDTNNRLPNNINVSILDIEGEALMLYLDSYNIAMSTGSACTSTSLDPSHVILAIGRPYEYAHGSMRFTLGKSTTKADLDYVLKVLPGVVAELRKISPVNLNPKKDEEISMKKAFVGQSMKKFERKTYGGR